MPRRKLPKHEELLKLYMEGWSYSALARRYDVDKNSVYHTLKRGQQMRGLPWPIQTEAQRRRKMDRYIKESMISPLLIAEVVEEFCEREGITLREFARSNQMHESWVYAIRNGKAKRIRPKYAVRLLEACNEPIPKDLLARAS